MKPQTLSEALALKEEFRQWLQAQFDSGSCPFTKDDLSFLGFDLCEGCPDCEDQIPLEPAPEPEPLPAREIKLFPVDKKEGQSESPPPFATYPGRIMWVPLHQDNLYPKQMTPFSWIDITCQHKTT